MGGICTSHNRLQEPTDAEVAALRDNLSNYKSRAQDYESQIHRIQAQIKAVTVVPADSEKYAIRSLISRELEDLKVLLLTLSPEAQLPGLSPHEQDFEHLKTAVYRWLELTKGSLHRLLQMKLRLQQLLSTGLTRLQTSQRLLGRPEIVAGDDLMQRLLSEYAVLVEDAYVFATATKESPAIARLSERIAKEEALTESLVVQASELSSALDRLRSDVAKKQLQLQTSKDWEAEALVNIDEATIELKRLKNELVLCKEKIRDLGTENDELDKALVQTSSPLTDEEMHWRTKVLRANVAELEKRRQTLQTEVFDVHNQLGLDEDTIMLLEDQLLRRDSIEDVGEKMSSVQEKLRDLMVSLESPNSIYMHRFTKIKRTKALSVDSETTGEVNYLATRYMELLGGMKSFNHRNSAAFVPKQILASRGLENRTLPRLFTGSKPLLRTDHSISESTMECLPFDRHASVCRGVLMKGSTVTTKYKFSKKATHPFLPLQRKPPLPLYTRLHTALLLKRPKMRIKLRKVKRQRREEPGITVAPWTFEKERGRSRAREALPADIAEEIIRRECTL